MLIEFLSFIVNAHKNIYDFWSTILSHLHLLDTNIKLYLCNICWKIHFFILLFLVYSFISIKIDSSMRSLLNRLLKSSVWREMDTKSELATVFQFRLLAYNKIVKKLRCTIATHSSVTRVRRIPTRPQKRTAGTIKIRSARLSRPSST